MFYNRPEVKELLAANNLKFVTDEQGNPLLNTSRKAGLLGVETVEPDAYTPEALYAALTGAERAEKDNKAKAEAKPAKKAEPAPVAAQEEE